MDGRFDFMDNFFKWTVLFIVLVILAAGGVAFYSVFLADRGMNLPSFREMSLIDAVADAEQLGLSVRIEQMDSKLPTGKVLAQWPEPGTRIRGSDRNVILKISKGGERRPMPNIRDINVTRATRMLEEQGFTVGDIIRIKDSSNSGLPAGSVIAQSPAADLQAIPLSYKVDLLVSEGTEDGRIAVPNASQMTESEAKELLESAGLRVSSVEKQRNRNVSEGQVINTRPAAGTMVNRGDGIRVFISMGDTSPVTGPETAATSPATVRPNEPNLTDLTVLDQPRQVRPETTPQRPGSSALENDPHHPEFNLPTPGRATTTPPPVVTPVAPTTPIPVANPGDKIARIRYTVPPILRTLPIKIEIVDPRGTRTLLERNARANETIQLDGSYTQEAVVTILLGGEFVWQERYR